MPTHRTLICFPRVAFQPWLLLIIFSVPFRRISFVWQFSKKVVSDSVRQVDLRIWQVYSVLNLPVV